MTSETVSFGWKVQLSGSFTIVAVFQGNAEYGPAVASIRVHAS
jgi:hypothetical protein